MSAYQMASLHTKHSKQLNLPLGSRWGVPEGTSVADCLNWTWKQPAPPPTAEKPEAQLVMEERTSVYVTPTSVDLDLGATSAIPAESPTRRAHAPTPKHMAAKTQDDRTCYHQEWVVTGRQKERPPTPADACREGRTTTTTPAPPTTRTTHQESVRTCATPTVKTARYGTTGFNTGRFSRQTAPKQNFVKTVSTKKKELTPPPLTFDEYLQETGHPLASGRPMTPLRSERFSSYPHYKPAPHPDDVEYIVKQTRSMKMRPSTPARPASRNGFNTTLLAPRTPADDMKEKAMIEAIRKELHSGRVSVEPRASAEPLRAASGRPRSQVSRSLSRPRTSNSEQLEIVKAKKTVGFMDENEYYRYLTYLEDRYGADCGATSSQAKHFSSWRGSTKEILKKKPVLSKGWVTPGSESPSKVNVEMDCPENADMTISLRVRNTPTATVY